MIDKVYGAWTTAGFDFWMLDVEVTSVMALRTAHMARQLGRSD